MPWVTVSTIVGVISLVLTGFSVMEYHDAYHGHKDEVRKYVKYFFMAMLLCWAWPAMLVGGLGYAIHHVWSIIKATD